MKIAFIQKSIYLIFLTFASLTLNAQDKNTTVSDSIKNYVDTIINILQHKSLFKESVNWTILKDTIYKKTVKAQKTEDVIPSIQYIFKTIGDKHGAIVYKGKWFGNSNRNINEIRRELLEQLKSVAVKVKTAIFENKYGYILIPSINTLDQDEVNKYAQQIQDSVCKLEPEKLKGWIIDLRLNTGGNMYPMIAGLGNLIGEGNIGSFVDSKGKLKINWIIKEGNLFFDNTQLTKIQKKCPLTKLPKIAVLISQVTSSSGEATAIALKGRVNTRFFGEKTSGYVTANNIYQIDNNSILLIAESYEADRNNLIYKNNVTPDVELVEGDNFYNLNKDLKIQAALKWLKK